MDDEPVAIGWASGGAGVLAMNLLVSGSTCCDWHKVSHHRPKPAWVPDALAS